VQAAPHLEEGGTAVFDAAHIYALDLETDTTINGLDPRVAAITECAVSTAAGDTVRGADHGEATMLFNLDRQLSALPPGLIVTWNGAFFDLPFLYTRRRILSVPPSSTLHSFGLHLLPQFGLTPKYDYIGDHTCGYTAVWLREDDSDVPHQHLDISFAYRKVAADLGVKHALKPVARALGITVIEVDREHMHLLTPAQRTAYAASDTRATRELAIRLLGA